MFHIAGERRWMEEITSHLIIMINQSVFINLLWMKVDKTTAAFSKNGVWINKAAVRLLDLGENPVSFRYYNSDVPLLGIINDFNFRSLHTKIGPIIILSLIHI